MSEQIVRGFDRGYRRGLIGMGLFTAAAGLMGTAGALTVPGASGGERAGAAAIGAVLLVVGVGAARLVQRRHWVEVDRSTGTVTISNFGSTTSVELCENCRLDTESFTARWNAPKLRCGRRTWQLGPMNRAPGFLGGSGDGHRLVTSAIRLSVPPRGDTE